MSTPITYNNQFILKKNNFWVWITILGSLFISSIFVLTGGSIFTAISVTLLIIIISITFYRLDWGFYLFVALVLFFDQFPPRGYGLTILGTEYFLNLKSLNIFKNIELAVLNPLEIHLLLILLIWLLIFITKKNLYFQQIPNWFILLLFFGWLIFSFIYGMRRGGDFLPALWELRALFYMGILIIITPQIIQSKEQIQNLMWIIIVVLSFKAFQGIIRIIRLGFNFGFRTELTNHEDPLFFISLFTLLLSLVLLKYKSGQKYYLYFTTPIILLVFFFSQRRAAYAALVVASIAFIALLHKIERKTLLKILIPFILIFALYTTLFWDNQSTIGIPAQLIRASITKPKGPQDMRYYSNLYREIENFNLAQTIKKSPLIGIGFGIKYDQAIPLVKIPFPLQEYIPHNEILWIFVKSGALGFFLFWFFFNTYIFQTSFLYNHLRDPYLKSIASVIIVAIIGQLVVSYYDLQLTYYRNMIYLGTMMGLIPTLRRYAQTDDKN